MLVEVAKDLDDPDPVDMVPCVFEATPCGGSLLSGHARFNGVHTIALRPPLAKKGEHKIRRSFNMRFRCADDESEAAADADWDKVAERWAPSFVQETEMRKLWVAGVEKILEHYKANPCVLPAYVRKEIAEYASFTKNVEHAAVAKRIHAGPCPSASVALVNAEETAGFMTAMLPELLKQTREFVPWVRAAEKWAPHLLVEQADDVPMAADDEEGEEGEEDEEGEEGEEGEGEGEGEEDEESDSDAE